LIPGGAVPAATKYFDIVAAGSSWCAEILKSLGCPRVATVLQGVDPHVFNASYSEKDYFRDAFVIFSGGKFELRKGQDIVIRAYKILQDKYPDVMLVNAWWNTWDSSVKTMVHSPHIRFSFTPSSHVARINRLLVQNGIDLRRVVTLPA